MMLTKIVITNKVITLQIWKTTRLVAKQIAVIVYL